MEHQPRERAELAVEVALVEVVVARRGRKERREDKCSVQCPRDFPLITVVFDDLIAILTPLPKMPSQS